MNLNQKTITGGFYITLSVIIIGIVLPIQLSAYTETESSLENLEISIPNVTLYWNSENVIKYIILDFVVDNPSSSLQLITKDIKIISSTLNNIEVESLWSRNVFNPFEHTIPAKTSKIISIQQTIYVTSDFQLFQNILNENPSEVTWINNIQIRGSMGTEPDVFIMGSLITTKISMMFDV